MNKALQITVAIPVRNEEQNLPACLEALGNHFAAIIVVDSGSMDQTREIAEAAGAEVLDFQWDGRFPKKRNWTLQTYKFHTPWILFLDADERVTPALIEELGERLPDSPHVGFWLSFENWFMERPLRHGDTFRKLALFRVGTGEYERFPEDYWSHLDMEVHEHPVLDGTVGEIQARLEHYDYRGMEHYLVKHNEYSSWEANRYEWLKAAGDSEWAKLTKRQQFKYRNLDQWWLGWAYWLVAYVFKSGFLDGKVGWTFNHLKRRYFADIRRQIHEAKKVGK
jgi:glycosyltransferase involved in cell wall biosynthesis